MIYIKQTTFWGYLKNCSFIPFVGYTKGTNVYIYQIKIPFTNKYLPINRLLQHELIHVAINKGIITDITHKEMDHITLHGRRNKEKFSPLVTSLIKQYPEVVRTLYVEVNFPEF